MDALLGKLLLHHRPVGRESEGARRTQFDFPPVNRERAWPVIAAMRQIAEAKGSTIPRIALAWLLHQPVVTSVIVGAKRIDQLEDNLGAVDVKLTDEELKTLDEVSRPPAEYPGWMLAFQGASRAPKPFEPKSEAASA